MYDIHVLIEETETLVSQLCVLVKCDIPDLIPVVDLLLFNLITSSSCRVEWRLFTITHCESEGGHNILVRLLCVLYSA